MRRLVEAVNYKSMLLASVILAVLAVQFTGVASSAHADPAITDTVTLPSGMDSNLVTSGVAVFLGIGVAAVAAVLGVKFLPLVTRYVFKWARMAVR